MACTSHKPHATHQAGLFEALLTAEDAVISDELNHASIIDGIRLCKAQRYRYKHMDMADLERCLADATDKGARIKVGERVPSF
jgi:glycine C-acetyltransferase